MTYAITMNDIPFHADGVNLYMQTSYHLLVFSLIKMVEEWTANNVFLLYSMDSNIFWEADTSISTPTDA